MNQRLVLIHTVPPLLEVFNRLSAELLPGVQTMHILDEPLLERVRRRGGLAAEDTARLATHVAEATEVGADAVLVTCSTVSPCVDDLRGAASIPVIKIDEAMIAEAVRLGSRIGVVATNRTTLEPTRALVEAEAQRAGKGITTELVLVEGALPALLAGDGETHDRLVKKAVLGLAKRSDVVLLAQASMARVMAIIPAAERPVPILSSPHLALAQVKALLDKRADRSNL
jgi:Asp/Glu/hydantoin racemase